MMRYFGLLLPQADEKGDMDKIWPMSKLQYTLWGTTGKMAESMLWERLFFS